MTKRSILGVLGAGSLVLAVLAAMSPADGAARRAGPVVAVHNLVSDQAGMAQSQDSDLVNAWGMAHGPDQPLWVSDNGSGVSTIYTGGSPNTPVAKVPLTVTIPGGSPTGQVYNGSSSFDLPSGYAARFIFAGEDGAITGWYSGTSAETVEQGSNAVYKGIAIDRRAMGPDLLVADFRSGQIDVFDTSFQPTSLAGSFTDPDLPAGYAPFNVAVLDQHVYVAYAVQDAQKMDDVPGAGHGIVDVYGLNGMFLKRLISHGALDSPWAMLIAPSTFGAFAGDLLVGNFGNGAIHAYDPSTGTLLGALRNRARKIIHIDGLWGLTRGDKAAGGPGAIWFSAGPDSEAHGLLGVLRVAS